MRSRIYLFDLDGTLLNDRHRIAPRTLTWLQMLKEDGHKLGIATGRPYEGILTSLTQEEFALFDYVTSYNGCRTDYEGKVITHKIPLEEIDQFMSMGDYTTSISVGDTLYTDNVSGAKDIIKRINPKYVKLIHEIPEGSDMFNIRLIFKNEKECDEWFETLTSKVSKQHYNIEKSTGIYILITPQGVSKAKGIREHLIDNRVIYFGDSHNDLSVFEMTTIIKVAPKNAVKEIKKLATHVLKTTNNETLEIIIED